MRQHSTFSWNGDYFMSPQAFLTQCCRCWQVHSQSQLMTRYLPRTFSRDRPGIHFLLHNTHDITDMTQWTSVDGWEFQIHLDNESQPNIHNGRSSLKYMCATGWCILVRQLATAANRLHTAYFLHDRCGHIKFDKRLANSSLYLQ